MADGAATSVVFGLFDLRGVLQNEVWRRHALKIANRGKMAAGESYGVKSVSSDQPSFCQGEQVVMTMR
jgi:hypothetical protein